MFKVQIKNQVKIRLINFQGSVQIFEFFLFKLSPTCFFPIKVTFETAEINCMYSSKDHCVLNSCPHRHQTVHGSECFLHEHLFTQSLHLQDTDYLQVVKKTCIGLLFILAASHQVLQSSVQLLCFQCSLRKRTQSPLSVIQWIL